jgi:hypothetical protein
LSAKNRTGKRVVFGALLIVVLVVGAIVFSLRLGGETIARVPVGEKPVGTIFHLAGPRKVTFWTDLVVTHDGISPSTSNDSLPHVADYVITVTHDGKDLPDLRCNPFDSNVARRSGKISKMGEPSGRSYDGLLNGCGFEGKPGDYVLTVRLEWRTRDPRIILKKTELLVRAD